MKPKCKIVFGVLFSLILATILGGCNGDDSTGVLVRGQVDDGTASSPIGAAKCLYLNENEAARPSHGQCLRRVRLTCTPGCLGISRLLPHIPQSAPDHLSQHHRFDRRRVRSI